jgi:2-keto-4-pentenoate hydratase
VLGPEAPENWRGADLATHKVRMVVGGMERTRGRGSDALGDPRLALTWLVNQLSQSGLTMAKGQLITTGVCGQPWPVARGDHIIGDFGIFGEVSARLV